MGPKIPPIPRFYSSLSPIIRLDPLKCSHNPQLLVHETNGPGEFCGLCWLMDGFDGEVPGRIHSYRLLAENGNPETSDKFLAHANLVMGLIPPKPGEDLTRYRRAREQLVTPPTGQFPVTAVLWKMFGFQPPLAEPLMYKLYGMPDWEIAERLGVSVWNVQVRLIKATRLALRYVRRDRTVEDPRTGREEDSNASRQDDRYNSQQNGIGSGRARTARPR